MSQSLNSPALSFVICYHLHLFLLELTSLSYLIRYLVAPDNVHHLFISQYAKEYPNASVIGVEGLDQKQKEVKWSGRESVKSSGQLRSEQGLTTSNPFLSSFSVYSKDPQPQFGFETEISARFFPTFGNKVSAKGTNRTPAIVWILTLL